MEWCVQDETTIWRHGQEYCTVAHGLMYPDSTYVEVTLIF